MITSLLKEFLKEKIIGEERKITIEDLKNKIQVLESKTIKPDDIDIDNYLRNASPTSIQISFEKFKRYHYFLRNKDKDLYVLRGGMGRGYGEEKDILDLEFFADIDQAMVAAKELAKESYEYSGQMDMFIKQYGWENCGSYPDQYEIDEDMLSWITYRVEKLTEESLKNIIKNEGRGDYEWYLDYFKWFA